MNDLDKTAPEALNETPDTAAAPAQAKNELNNSDPVPALGGATKDEVRLRASGPITFERLDDDLFAAVQAGDLVHVRARLGGSDKPLTEAEEIILVRARQNEDELAYERLMEALDLDDADDDDDEPAVLSFSEHAHHVSHAAMLLGVDAYGGRYDRKKSRYQDRFGGTYDLSGYRAEDGSYKTSAGDWYNANTHTVRLAIGGPEERLPENLIDMGEDIIRVALQVAEIRNGARAERMAVAQDIPAATVASDAADAAATVVRNAAAAAPVALAKMPIHAAAESDEAFLDACIDRAEAAKARFEKLAKDESFQAAAADSPGGAMGLLDACPALTRKDLKMAAEILGDNLKNGRLPADMMRYHYKNILNMADDAEDAVACALQPNYTMPKLDLSHLPSITDDANNVFAKPSNRVLDLCLSLKDKADAAFAKKPGATPPVVVPAIVAAGMQKYRNALRRTLTAGMA